ncbi:MAG: glycosyltransferase family 39 protein [Vicinamibacteria bacterium]
MLRLLFIWLEPTTHPIADETMWLMALSRIPAAHFSPFANYPIFHPPLYPYFLAAMNMVFGSLTAIKIVQVLLGSLLIPAVAHAGRRLIGLHTGLAAACFAAFYPELIWYSAHFWCETLFLAILWWGIERVLSADESGSVKTAAVAGLLLGLSVLTRETILYLVPLATVWLAWNRPRARWRLGATVLLSMIVVVAPWTIRNWMQFGAFIPVSTGGGLNLYQGNTTLTRGEVYDEYYKNEGKVDQFVFARAEGIKAILSRQPWWLFEKIRDEGPLLAEVDSLALIHIRRGAYGAATCSDYRAAAVVVLFPWILIAGATVVAASRLRLNRQSVFLVGLIVAYLLLHIATHGFARYRLPVLPAFMIMAASLFDHQCMEGRSAGRRALQLALVVALGLLWAPSLFDQAGDFGFTAAPTYEGFAPLCGV